MRALRSLFSAGEEVMYCPKCGTENKGTAKYCKKCGETLSTTRIDWRAKFKSDNKLSLIGLSVLILAAVIAAIVFFTGSGDRGSLVASRLPSEIRKKAFEIPDFTEVTTERQGDSREDYQEYKAKIEEYRLCTGLCLPPVCTGVVRQVWNDGLQDFFIDVGYAEIRSLESAHGDQCEFLFYTDSIEPYVISNNDTSSYITILLAERKLTAISRAEEYEQLGVKGYVVDFTYTFDEVIPQLPNIKEKFNGKAELHWEPIEGGWVLDLLTLDDEGSSEYGSLLEENE